MRDFSDDQLFFQVTFLHIQSYVVGYRRESFFLTAFRFFSSMNDIGEED